MSRRLPGDSLTMGKEMHPEKEQSRPKRVWESPKIEEVGDLQTLVQTLNSGKPSLGVDGTGQGGGEEMFMT